MNLPEIRLLAEIDDLTRYCQEPSVVQENRRRAELIAQDYWNQIATLSGEPAVFQAHDVGEDLPEPGWPDEPGDDEC